MHKGCKKLGPKDYFTIPRIDQRVDSTTKCQRLSFWHVYSSHNQITMDLGDVDKTTYIILGHMEQ